MIQPSRRMAPKSHSVLGWLWMAAIGAAFLVVVYLWLRNPYSVGLFTALFACPLLFLTYLDQRRLRQFAHARRHEGICSFARSFPRNTDTWILRAVYEETSVWLGIAGRPTPVRKDDDFEQDLKIESEDLEDIARDAALRARRSLERWEANPMHGKVQTVADLVRFLQHQPIIVEPVAPANAGRTSGS